MPRSLDVDSCVGLKIPYLVWCMVFPLGMEHELHSSEMFCQVFSSRCMLVNRYGWNDHAIVLQLFVLGRDNAGLFSKRIFCLKLGILLSICVYPCHVIFAARTRSMAGGKISEMEEGSSTPTRTPQLLSYKELPQNSFPSYLWYPIGKNPCKNKFREWPYPWKSRCLWAHF